MGSRLKVLGAADVQAVGIEGRKPELDVNVTKQVVFHRPSEQMRKHLWPSSNKAEMNGIPVGQVLVDNGIAINTIPFRMLRKFGKSEEDLMPLSIVLTDFSDEIA